jgi:hypothetical protein
MLGRPRAADRVATTVRRGGSARRSLLLHAGYLGRLLRGRTPISPHRVAGNRADQHGDRSSASVRRWRWRRWRSRWRRRRRGGLGRYLRRIFRGAAGRRRWRRRHELALRSPQPRREHATREPVQRHDSPVAPSGAAEVYVPASMPVEAGVMGVVDDEPVGAREVGRDGHRFRLRQDSRRRAWMRHHDARAGEQHQYGKSLSHAYLNTNGSRLVARVSDAHRLDRPLRSDRDRRSRVHRARHA